MKYKVGDLVRIKTWEQMASEFGVTDEGNIACTCTFTKLMKEYCGTIQEISSVHSFFYDLTDVDFYCFSDDMIEGLAVVDILTHDRTPVSEETNSEEPAGHDPVNHPSHYCQEGSMECIDEMVAVFGKEAVMNFCLCNVWKYRKRALHKNGEEDLKKSDWYMNKYVELKGEL